MKLGVVVHTHHLSTQTAEYCVFEAILDYRARPCLKTTAATKLFCADLAALSREHGLLRHQARVKEPLVLCFASPDQHQAAPSRPCQEISDGLDPKTSSQISGLQHPGLPAPVPREQRFVHLSISNI